MAGSENKRWREDYDVQCPFYRQEDSKTVSCEGITPETGLHLCFPREERKQAYKLRFCRRHWKRCLITKMLNRMYDYEP